MTLNKRITLIAVISMLMVAGLVEGVSLHLTRLTQARVASAVLDGTRHLWEQQLDKETGRMAHAIDALSADSDLRQAVKADRPADIIRYAERYMAAGEGKGLFETLQLYTPRLEQTYSSTPDLALHAIDPSLETVVAANAPAHGIFMATDGNPRLALIAPIRSRHHLIGVAVLVKPLDDLLTAFANASDGGAALFAHGLRTRYRFPELNDLAPHIADIAHRPVWPGETSDKRYVIAAMPLTAPDGSSTGYLLTSRDDTKAISALHHAKMIGYVLMAALVLTGAGVLTWQVRRYLSPLETTALELRDIASGNLSGPDSTAGVAEIGVLREGMSVMCSSLRGLATAIGQAATEVRDTSGTIRNCVEEANRNVSEQENRSERISVALSEMADAITSAAEVTEQAAGAAQAMGDSAHQGHTLMKDNVASAEDLNTEMDRVSATIEALNNQATQVARIVEVIKEIAEQTNLLALNAAIEAARAGEQGRGFSVVADEVRALASRTQQSTTEIEEIIHTLLNGTTDSVSRMQRARDHVEQNMNKANSALLHFNTIRMGIDELVEINHTIAAAVEEQNNVTRQVASEMDGIRELASANARRTAYLTDTTANLHRLAEDLTGLTGRFRWQDG